MATSDGHAVRQAADGNRDSFDRLVTKYQSAVLAICYELLGSYSDAQDATQETFMRAFQNIAKVREPEKFSAWLRTITTNTCRSSLRRSVGTEPVDELQTGEIPTRLRSPPDQLRQLMADEKRQAVVDLIDVLSDKSQMAARMHYVDGLSYQEISELLDVPISTVESRLHRAREKLKAELKDGYRSRRSSVLHRLTDIVGGDRNMDEIRVEIGWELVPSARDDASEGLTGQIRRMRGELAQQQELRVPPVRIIDCVELPPRGYNILIREVRCSSGELEDLASVPEVVDALRRTLVEQRAIFE